MADILIKRREDTETHRKKGCVKIQSEDQCDAAHQGPLETSRRGRKDSLLEPLGKGSPAHTSVSDL